MIRRTKRAAEARERPLMPARQIFALCYLGALTVWLVYCLLGCAAVLDHKMDGTMRTLTLAPEELVLESLVPYTDLPGKEPPDGREGWYVSTDGDPHILWQGAAYVETVQLLAEHRQPAGGVVLYYLLPGQTDYRESQKVFARCSGQGVYTFDLGGKTVVGLRIDPDSRGGVQTLLQGVRINPETAWYLRFVPGGGQWLLLLALPALAAALVGLALDLCKKGGGASAAPR